MSHPLLDRIRGCLLAGAIGDAMGGPFENQPGSRIAESPWAGVVPFQSIVYNQTNPPHPRFNPPVHPPCYKWRPPITAVLIHARSGAPNGPTSSPSSFHGPHPGGCNFLLMDGSTRIITDGIGLPVFRALCTRNGQEITSIN